jgi:hypothetical protein
MVNVPLLCEIGRQKNFKPGWAWIKAKEIRAARKELVHAE